MRKSEITPELIELSKKAKEIGFPQDVEEGDWVHDSERNEVLLFGKDCFSDDAPYDGVVGRLKTHDFRGYVNGYIEKEHWFLILSFSRCLEWLRDAKYTLMCLRSDLFTGTDNNCRIELFNYETRGNPMTEPRRILRGGKTHHEAIAKAVIKILEGK